MTIPFPFDSLIVFSWLGIMLLVGVFLRSKVPFIQRFLIPSCLIGGLIGMILVNLKIINIKSSDLETFAYHLFNISFISVGLTMRSKEDKAAITNKELLKGSLWMALLQGVVFPLQAIIGGISVLLFNSFGINIYSTFGFLVPLGFVQGPGQALSIGKVWETKGFESAASIGLTFAAIGFLIAFFVGVPIVNRGIRKGRSANTPKDLPEDFIKGIFDKDNNGESAGQQTTHSGNIDTMAFQASIIGMIYLLSYVLIFNLAKLLPPAQGSTLWGFFFFIGLGIALLVRFILGKLGIEYLIDPGIQRRITGWSVDFLLVATVMAVKFVLVWKYIIPITIMAVVNAVMTTVVVLFLGKRIWSYNLERTAAIYGTVTGTVSTGLLLLRIVDPDFKTSVALELGILIIFVSPIIITSMLLVSAPVIWGWTLPFTIAIFAGIMIASLLLLKILGMMGKARY